MRDMRVTRSRNSTPWWTIGRAPALKRMAFIAVAVGSVAVAAACGGSESPSGPGNPPGPTTPVGAWTIATVNAKTLPFTMFTDTNYLYEVTAGTFSFTSDGKYSRTITFRQTIPGNISIFVDSSSGTWVLSASKLMITDGADSSLDSATFASGKLTFIETNGATTNTFVYTPGT